MSKILLSDIKELHFFEGVDTKSRRSSPIPQLTCVGKVCKKYQPSSVSCTNIGGKGNDVTWKCNADLPNSLRFGKIDVSCEGWRKPGDTFVLEGSCGLTYDLLKLDHSLYDDDSSYKTYTYNRSSRWSYKSERLSSLLFSLAFCAIFSFILYSFLKACFTQNGGRSAPRITGPGGGGGSDVGATPGGGFFSNSNDNDNPPPPPYTSRPKPDPSTGSTGWRPGFWTGLGLGGLGSYLFGGGGRRPSPYDDNYYRQQQRRQAWDWERPWGFGNAFNTGPGGFRTRFPSSSEGFWSNNPSRNVDRGEGSSNLGSMRSSSGLARSNVR